MTQTAAVIGAGPAGLMAAETLARAGQTVTLYDQMPSVGRKLLMAGRGGLNLTHAEPLPVFLSRYGTARAWLEPIISNFPPEAVIGWCNGLEQPTFTGSSARVFPATMKSSPLLRAWLRRLADQGARLRVRHRWAGWDAERNLCFHTPNGVVLDRPDVTILALGGASWPRLGSDAGWTAYLPGLLTPFQPANCGFRVDWSPHFRTRFAGRPLKRLAIRFGPDIVRGEALITEAGIEGGIIYALSARLRDTIQAEGMAIINVDLRPDLTQAALEDRLGGPRRSQSLANTLRKQAGLSPDAIGLVQEALHGGATPDTMPQLIKSLPIRLIAPASIQRAISSAGGLRADALDASLMLRDRPGVFAAGEMLDWEAPTGGYLLQACFSTGVAAAGGALAWLESRA
ncbi:TIGR03862 family flavoprotein [Acidisphaera sp. S103]|uniref:TIGR03862 family flavoprotein n=1 Tax=Acidisphaera sp. S103 TaxID=1747223 RepID=UPI00131BD029|nr:TIGR03862 family flavoprotein [Acidisphaera sp. S103]